jgi:hypothetical protein
MKNLLKFISPICTNFKINPIFYGIYKKKVKFAKKNQIYLIHTIDEIKEYLPDLYWNYDITFGNENIQLQFLEIKTQTYYDNSNLHLHLEPHYSQKQVQPYLYNNNNKIQKQIQKQTHKNKPIQPIQSEFILNETDFYSIYDNQTYLSSLPIKQMTKKRRSITELDPQIELIYEYDYYNKSRN